jgi:hypothetical protein
MLQVAVADICAEDKRGRIPVTFVGPQTPRFVDVQRPDAGAMLTLLRDAQTAGTDVLIDDHYDLFEILAVAPATRSSHLKIVNTGAATPIVQPVMPFLARTAFNYLALNGTIPFEYGEDGCYARAHEMCRLLAGPPWNLPARKVWVHGSLRPPAPKHPFKSHQKWGYHVAPIVTVNSSTGIQTLVLDPALFGRPVSIQEWAGLQEAKNPPVETGPEVYVYSTTGKPMTDTPNYDDTNEMLAIYLSKLAMRQACLKSLSRPTAAFCDLTQEKWGADD